MLFLKKYIDVCLIYSVVLISAAQQNYTYIFIFFSSMAYYRVLNIVPCAMQ